MNKIKVGKELERIKEKIQFEYNLNMDLIKLLEKQLKEEENIKKKKPDLFKLAKGILPEMTAVEWEEFLQNE